MVHLEPKEVKRLLRQLGQPVQLFGEEDEARLERYQAVHAAVLAARESDEDIELKQGQMFNETQLYDETGRAKQEGVQAEAEGAEQLDLAWTFASVRLALSRVAAAPTFDQLHSVLSSFDEDNGGTLTVDTMR